MKKTIVKYCATPNPKRKIMAKRKTRRKAKARRAAPARRRRSYVTNPAPVARRRRRYRKNPGLPIAALGMQALAGAAGAIGVPKLADMLPIPAQFKNAVVLALGAAAMVFAGKMPAVRAAGFGAMVTGARGMLTNAVPMLAGDNELTMDEILALEEFAGGGMSPSNPFGAPLADPLAAPLAGLNNYSL